MVTGIHKNRSASGRGELVNCVFSVLVQNPKYPDDHNGNAQEEVHLCYQELLLMKHGNLNYF